MRTQRTKPIQQADAREDTSNKTEKRARAKSKNKKNISIAEPFKRIVDAVVQPLKEIARQKKKRDEVDVPFAESKSATELTTSMKFFYSNDRFIETFDDQELYEMICKKWPALKEDQLNLQHKRNAILELLKDEKLIQHLDDQYGMSIFDVISFLFRICPSLFRGIFVKKLQNAVKGTKYAKKLKKHEYKTTKMQKKSVKHSQRR